MISWRLPFGSESTAFSSLDYQAGILHGLTASSIGQRPTITQGPGPARPSWTVDGLRGQKTSEGGLYFTLDLRNSQGFVRSNPPTLLPTRLSRVDLLFSWFRRGLSLPDITFYLSATPFSVILLGALLRKYDFWPTPVDSSHNAYEATPNSR
ncbi:uncharacterized protein CLUP02_05319 [Colletotrichum lupini]|uniref:Uncharacterized protein n=1 Tax=Colletotrichum lupini TaxID=145971 RepID=A0A9Q8WDY5_9PEZI|nr:uncharacterized protein CLUP02_05319 [Colletotrichum lupini]UQC79839.1 hypothetical protein CLUP02_05319 [Colletotrichum lupini]